MNDAAVSAIVYGAPEDPVTAEVVSAVLQQTQPLREVITDPVDLGTAVARAATIRAAWVWLLDGGAVPEPRALETLLGTGGEDPAIVLLSSRVLGPNGALDPGSLPRHVIYATDISVAAAERGLIQIRAAGSGSVLLSRQAVLGLGRSGPDMLQFSARLLRNPAHAGYLVPRSVAVRRHALAPDLVAQVRGLGGEAWTPRERLREAFRLSRQLAGSAGASRRAVREQPP